jgi:hypothetical protein
VLLPPITKHHMKAFSNCTCIQSHSANVSDKMGVTTYQSVSLNLRIHLQIYWKERSPGSVSSETCPSFNCNRADEIIPVIQYTSNYTLRPHSLDLQLLPRCLSTSPNPCCKRGKSCYLECRVTMTAYRAPAPHLIPAGDPPSHSLLPSTLYRSLVTVTVLHNTIKYNISIKIRTLHNRPLKHHVQHHPPTLPSSPLLRRANRR